MKSFLLFGAVLYAYINLIDFKLFGFGYDLGFFGKYQWKRKYKLIGGILQPPKQNWYYRLFNIEYEERFLFSSNLLVAFTDARHFAQQIMIIFICLATSPASPKEFFILWVLFHICWTVTYLSLPKVFKK